MSPVLRPFRVAALAGLVLATACGDDGGTGPTFCGNIPVALFDNVPSFALADLRPAIVDAGTRLVPALPDSPARTQLRTSLQNLSLANAADEGTCTEFSVAVAALGAIENSAGTSPEAASVRVVLELVGASLRGP